MKKLLLVCLLGIGTLLPANEAKSSKVYQHQIVNITIEAWYLTGNSDEESGKIESIKIYKVSTGKLVLQTDCEGYTCGISLSGLSAGLYIAHVRTENEVATKQFLIGG